MPRRYFEPKWLYSHHKIVYHNDVLLKYLMKISSVCLSKEHQKQMEKFLLDLINDRDESIEKVFKQKGIIFDIIKKEYSDFVTHNKGTPIPVSSKDESDKNINSQNNILKNKKNLQYKAKKFCLYLLNKKNKGDHLRYALFLFYIKDDFYLDFLHAPIIHKKSKEH